MAREHEYSRSLPPSAAPSRPLCPVVSSRASLGAHVYMCRSLARASSRSTWCVPRGWGTRTVRVEGTWYWRTRVPCHLRSLAARALLLVGRRWLVSLPKQTGGALPPRGLFVSMVPSLELRVASSCALDAYSRVLNCIRLARSFARGARAAVQVIGAQLKALRCGWTTVDFVGQVRATNAAPSRANLRATAAPWRVLRLSRGSLALLPVSASCTDSPGVVVFCLGLLIRPLSVASLRCRTPTHDAGGDGSSCSR
jgi:hypothetical protein